MYIDKESSDPNEDNTSPPFLDQEQQEQLTRSFTLENFRIVASPWGGPFVAIAIPDSAQSLVENISGGTRGAALKNMRLFGQRLMAPGLSEEQERRIREGLSQRQEDLLKSIAGFYLKLTWNVLSYAAYYNAHLGALKKAASIADVTQRLVALEDLSKKDSQIGAVLFGDSPSRSARYAVYSGNQEIYKTPEDLVTLDVNQF